MRLIAIGLALGMAAGGVASAAAQGRVVPPGNPQGEVDGSGRGGMMDRGGPPPARGAAPTDHRLAELDGRLSEIGGNLRLAPDQQKLWPAVEDAVRGVVRQRLEAKAALRDRVAALRDARASGQGRAPRNVPEELRMRAQAAAAETEAMRRLAQATAPLFDSLDDRQRRRFGQIIPAMAQAGRNEPKKARRGPSRQQPASGQAQGQDDDMDEDTASGMQPSRRQR
jgi:hypothetical protein